MKRSPLWRRHAAPLRSNTRLERALTNSFSGIAPIDVPMFIVAQLAGALAGLVIMRWFFAASHIREGLAASERA